MTGKDVHVYVERERERVGQCLRGGVKERERENDWVFRLVSEMPES